MQYKNCPHVFKDNGCDCFRYLNMKLRIKYNSTRTTIDVPDEGTLQDLLQQCQAICQVRYV